MMPDYYENNTILSSIHEFVIMMLDYYRIDTSIVDDYEPVIILGLFTM
jgi:hypothetical protein